MRDPRFPPHEDIRDAILGWLSVGPDTAEGIRNGLASVFELSIELQCERFDRSGTPIWHNYVAHGLRAFTIPGSAPMPVHEQIDDHYQLTELGKQRAKRAVGEVPDFSEEDILEQVTRPGTNWI